MTAFEQWLEDSGYAELIKTVHFGYDSDPDKIREALREAFDAGRQGWATSD